MGHLVPENWLNRFSAADPARLSADSDRLDVASDRLDIASDRLDVASDRLDVASDRLEIVNSGGRPDMSRRLAASIQAETLPPCKKGGKENPRYFDKIREMYFFKIIISEKFTLPFYIYLYILNY